MSAILILKQNFIQKKVITILKRAKSVSKIMSIRISVSQSMYRGVGYS